MWKCGCSRKQTGRKTSKEEGIDKIFEEAGFKLRQPGCSVHA